MRMATLRVFMGIETKNNFNMSVDEFTHILCKKDLVFWIYSQLFLGLIVSFD